MDFRQIEAFCAVVEENSFSKAAQKLCVTQPTVSTHINSLEKELNTQLISRTTKSIAITDEGISFYEYASSILRIRQRIYQRYDSSGNNFIHLGASTIPSAYILPEILVKYHDECPLVSFDIWQSDSLGVIEKVIDGSLDLGITGVETAHKSCVCESFCDDELIIAAPATEHYIRLKEQDNSLNKLLNEPIILRESGSGTKKEADKLLESLGMSNVSLNVIAHMNDLESIKRSIASGLGISILSYKSVKDMIESGKLIYFHINEKRITRNFYIIYRKNYLQSKQLQHFINFIKTYVKNQEE